MSEEQPTTWYRIAKWDDKVSTVEVEAETEHTLTIRGRREHKRTEYRQRFPTHDEAVRELYRRVRAKIDNARYALEQAERGLDALRSQYPEPDSEGAA